MSFSEPGRRATAQISASARLERRQARRTCAAFRARIRPIHEGPAYLEEVCKTLNISLAGIYFSCAHSSYRPHMHLYVSCPDSNSAFDRAAEMARVVRVDTLRSGEWGVAVNYLRCTNTAFHRASQHKAISSERGQTL